MPGGQNRVAVDQHPRDQNVQPGHDRQRQPGQRQEGADGRLRLGRSAARDLRQRRRLRRHRPRHLQRYGNKPHREAQKQAGQRLGREMARVTAGIGGNRHQLRRQRRGQQDGHRQRRAEPDAHGDVGLADRGQHHERRADAQEDQRSGQNPSLREAEDLRQQIAHGAATPTRAGFASSPTSSNERTGFRMPRDNSTVRRNRRRSDEVTTAG